MRSVARAEPSSVVSRLSDGDTTQVRAGVSKVQLLTSACDSPNTQHDEPLGSLGSVAILLRVSQRLDVDGVGLFNLVGSSVSDENWLSSPFDDEVLACGQCGPAGMSRFYGLDRNASPTDPAAAHVWAQHPLPLRLIAVT